LGSKANGKKPSFGTSRYGYVALGGGDRDDKVFHGAERVWRVILCVDRPREEERDNGEDGVHDDYGGESRLSC